MDLFLADALYIALFFGLAIVLAIPATQLISEAESGVFRYTRWLTPFENLCLSFLSILKTEDQTWKQYLASLLWFNVAGFIILLLLLEVQHLLPWSGDIVSPMPFWVAVNSTVSFVTNTNWQAYAGETGVSPLVQMVGFGVQNFVSPATGLAVVFFLARSYGTIQRPLGNFYVDVTRITIRVLLPVSLIVAGILVVTGVPQTYASAFESPTMDGGTMKVPVGTVASQVAIKQIGTNGGGYYNTNSAHPLENPTEVSNLVSMLSIIVLPIAGFLAWGRITGRKRHGKVLVGALSVLFLTGAFISLWSEHSVTPELGGGMEGKETRFGIANTILWSVCTTASSNGSVNGMHESLSPTAGAVAMFNMMMGEVVFGGVGSGTYGVIAFVIVTVFLVGLMVGRSPEYLGRPVTTREIRLALLAIILPSIALMLFAAVLIGTEYGRSAIVTNGAHGISVALYNAASAAGNNGSAFGGYDGTNLIASIGGALVMLIGRYGVIIPMIALAGSVHRQRSVAPGAGTFSTNTITFAITLILVIVAIGALTFLPMITLGPIAEALALNVGGIQ